MAGFVEVNVCVLVRTRVAASDMTAGQTHAQVCPRTLTEFLALLAFTGCEALRLDELGRQVLAHFGDRRGTLFALA